MKKKFIHDISSNALQVIINQFCGLLIFYLLSAFLSKDDFGNLNWSLAVLLTSFSMLSFGMEQVVVKKIAGGENAAAMFSLYSIHVFIAGFLFYGLLIAANVIFPVFFSQHQLLLWLGIGKLLLFFASPFKQVAAGLEQFRSLMLMSTTSNIVRSVALLLIVIFFRPGISTVVIIFIAGDAMELLAARLITRKIISLKWSSNPGLTGYRQLVRESLPQVGVVIFSAAIARFDWILLGLLSTGVILANYSFAYKAIELSTLPLLVIAPILVPKFTKIFHQHGEAPSNAPLQDMYALLNIEMIIASLTAVCLSACWVPLADWLTADKYGAVNHTTIQLLTLGIPLLYFNNFLWTIHFTKGSLRMIFYIFLFSFLTNLIADLLLIPFFNAEGAAAAYVMALVVQTILFLQQTSIKGMARNCIASLQVPLSALISLVSAEFLFTDWRLSLPATIILFFLSLLFTKATTRNHRQVLRRVTGF